MTGNYDISFEETVDPAGCNCGPDEYQVFEASLDKQFIVMTYKVL